MSKGLLEGWLTTTEAARLSGFTRQRIDQLSRAGDLEAMTVAGRRFISKQSFDAWAATRNHRSHWHPRTLRELRFKRAEILSLAERLHIENVRVFGSVARDDANDASDVDFLVSCTGTATAMDVAEFAGYVEDIVGTRVDVVVDDSPAVARIAAEAVPL